VVTDPRLQLTRLDLADDALSGPAHTTIWGTSVSTLSWRWPEAVLVAAVALGVLLWLRRRRSVRTRAQAG
jgi:aminopeptidase-like protein